MDSGPTNKTLFYLYRSFKQVVRATRLEGEDHPLEVVYFIEGASGHRMPATEAAHLLNSMDVQRAAIVLGYRVQGVLAQRESLHYTAISLAVRSKDIGVLLDLLFLRF